MHWKYIGLKIPNKIRKTKSSLLEAGSQKIEVLP